MPRAEWGIRAGTVKEYDRSKDFTPYQGPMPPLAVYKFRVKVLRYAPATDEKNPQLRIGLELVPRNKEEGRYKGYFVMLFRAVTENSAGFYVPFLDAIGVTDTEFTTRTIVDEEGNIKKIGAWRNAGTQEVMALLKDSFNERSGETRRDVGWFGAATDSGETDDDDTEDEEEEYEEEEPEETPPPKATRRNRGGYKSASPGASLPKLPRGPAPGSDSNMTSRTGGTRARRPILTNVDDEDY